jgi:rod shape-determining protein MreC
MMRRRGWGWERWAMVALVAGHGLWITFGRGDSGRLQGMLDLLARPSRAVSARLQGWGEQRRQRVTDLRKAQTEILTLRAQVTGLQVTRAADAARLAEADEAIRLLGLKKLLPLSFQAARVVVNVRKAPFGGMILDQGADAGLVPDQGVICPDGVVGRVWEVGPSQSSLLPLDSYNASTGVMLARSRATGVLQGTGPGKASIRYIGAQEGVQVGEPVYTSGLDRVFPRGLLVGYVSAVRPRDVELQVEVVLAAPLDRVGLVLVLPAHPDMEIKPPSAPPAPGPQGGSNAKQGGK